MWKYLWIDPWDGGDGCVTQVDPEDDNTVYYSAQHGAAVRLDRKADTMVSIQPELPQGIRDTLLFNYITPYFISPHHRETLYHGGNYIFKSADRGNHWEVISPNLAMNARKGKRSFSTGALAESPIRKGLLYAGTDKGAFWVSKNDGESWEEHDNGLANNYIRSICPARFAEERVYVAMTGINYDDLGAYLYVSDDYGKSWTSIAGGLPDEPVHVILEDTRDERVLYAGCFRGVFVSIDRGRSWSYLGHNMPGTAIADLEIHESSGELVAATHGRGIFKINIGPLRSLVNEGFGLHEDRLFATTEIKLPRFDAASGAPDYRSFEKADIVFWLREARRVRVSLRDTEQREVWSVDLDGAKGFNQYRWDLIVRRQDSDLPYFTQYEKWVKAGRYTLVLTDGKSELTQAVLVTR